MITISDLSREEIELILAYLRAGSQDVEQRTGYALSKLAVILGHAAQVAE